jgi:hypothetical protein
LDIPILVDELDGSIHKKYGGMPNPTFLIDRSGQVAFRSTWTDPKKIAAALEALQQAQEARNTDHAVVLGGEHTSMPALRALLHTHRALQRGGKESIRNYREQLGRAGQLGDFTSRFAEPVALHPVRAVIAAALAGGAITGGLMLGRQLRRDRFGALREPYNYVPRGGNGGEYAVGI